jgi:integrase
MTVAKLLGHTSSRMVELVYGRLNDLTCQNAVATLPSLRHRSRHLKPARSGGW